MNSFTDPAIGVTRSDVRVQQGEYRCAKEWRKDEDTEIPTEVPNSPDR
jgi:hypothetical protein